MMIYILPSKLALSTNPSGFDFFELSDDVSVVTKLLFATPEEEDAELYVADHLDVIFILLEKNSIAPSPVTSHCPNLDLVPYRPPKENCSMHTYINCIYLVIRIKMHYCSNNCAVPLGTGMPILMPNMPALNLFVNHCALAARSV